MRAKDWRQGLMTGALVVLALWIASLIWGLAGKAEVAVREAHSAQAQYRALEERKAALAQSLDTLATPLGQDAAIRTAFGVARLGEEVIVVVPPSAAPSAPLLPWWRRVLNWF